MNTVLKAGAIILSKNNPDKIAIIYRKEENDFSFPKGHLEAGETLEQCAIRETKEETGLDIQIVSILSVIPYTNKSDGHVETTYYLARSIDDSAVQPEPGVDVFWMTISEALEKISYENLRQFLKETVSIIEKYKKS